DSRAAAAAYLAELKAHEDDDTAWYNTGTAALAAGDPTLARSTLARAAASLDPELRFRALYNLGLLALLEAKSDTTGREAHLADAERAYREALLLKPFHVRAKWNLELVNRLRRGGGQNQPNPPPPPSPGGGGGGEELTLTVRARTRSADAVEIVLPSLNGFAIVGSRDMTEVAINGASGSTRTTVRELQLRAQQAGALLIGPVRARQGVSVVATD